jgi:hypothetical protein
VRAMSHHSRKPNSPYHPRHERAKYPNVGQGLLERGRPGEQIDDYQRGIGKRNGVPGR